MINFLIKCRNIAVIFQFYIMPQEIERKFLVTSETYRASSYSNTRISQGYISTNPSATVRVRIRDDKGFLTIKGESSENGTTRYEWEKEIPLNEAKELLQLCGSGVIEKIRYKVNYKGFVYEIDEFSGENKGLVVAEIELNHEDEVFAKPDWLGREVTGDARYYNAMLAGCPYSKW